MEEVTVTVTMLCESADKAAVVVEEAMADLLEQQDVDELYDFDWEYVSTKGENSGSFCPDGVCGGNGAHCIRRRK